ncbi:ATP-binding protein [Agromyces sp. Leaf222]|uniref:ATP-binding protein n=1 Tax=Agromyces sp. Leaf222 TaxID=1735688 RepID=UPI000700B5A4|nr:ATP-binding protein [Agromyces sp. Leaf222]KQM82332.1 ATPase [Agromyces sp. Leaf222]
MGQDPGLAHLLGRLGAIEDRIRRLVAARRAVDPQPDDPFRGLYLSDELIDRMLEGAPGVPDWSDASARLAACEQAADMAEAAGHPVRLRRLADEFGLAPIDVDLLVIALAADLDPRFERFFGYLNDDVGRRRPSVTVALELCGVPLTNAADRARLLTGPLVTGGLVIVEDEDRPLPGRAVRVPDRVVGHLLGDDTPDRSLDGVLVDAEEIEWGDDRRLRNALAGGIRLMYLRETATGSGEAIARRALRASGLGTVQVDLPRLGREADAAGLARLAVREARLTGRGVVVSPVTLETEPALIEVLADSPRPTVLVGEPTWDPGWFRELPAMDDVEASTTEERTALWTQALGKAAEGLDVAAATAQFRLRPEQVLRASATARTQASLSVTGEVTTADLATGARAENASALDRLARRVTPRVGWVDLVLPPITLDALQEIEVRARHREQVLGDWGMRPGGGRGHGVVGLFAGDSGTGKTMSAEVVAGELGLDLYVIDLSSVVDKYIGETEKNLERIFVAAAGTNAVLLFDEADAVFGKRSDVKDSHDRYANVESAYLLQRMETFDGLAILATNLRANIDEAFTRRLDVIVDFPMPDAAHRTRLWDRSLGSRLRRGDDLDLVFLGDAFELAGGGIRSAAVTAAYLAAGDDGIVRMRHLVIAVHREYRKLGRLVVEREFGPYWPVVAGR